MNYFCHPNSLCESVSIGKGTRIWAFAHVLPGAVIGEDCNICDGVFVEGNVVVGDRVTVKCGVQLWDGVRLANDVFVGPNATFTNDRFPRSRQHPEAYAETFVEAGASIGANATILPGIRIGSGAMVGAGAVITRSVPPNAIVVGNPARIVGYVTDSRAQHPAPQAAADEARVSSVAGVKLHELPRYQDLRGALSVGEFSKDLPFEPKRYFLVFDVPSQETRGEHAHRICHQFLICVKGSVRVLADDGTRRDEFVLDSPSVGLHLPPMIWGTQYQYSPGAVLLVFASENYDGDEYIRQYDEFIKLTAVAAS
ncbi:WxcM-like domain-containing protein [Stenotrophomonas sp. AR029]|uniref:WxcM-like domain-containing protein n=1 Tax=Stenotrophomonas sp. AR029 TaxID=3398601 RepID=UPI0039C67A0C